LEGGSHRLALRQRSLCLTSLSLKEVPDLHFGTPEKNWSATLDRPGSTTALNISKERHNEGREQNEFFFLILPLPDTSFVDANYLQVNNIYNSQSTQLILNNKHKMLKHKMLKYYVLLLFILTTCFGLTLSIIRS
jgi:hypothetical protein